MISKNILMFAIIIQSSVVSAKTIDEIKFTDCKNKLGSFFKINVTEQTISAKFGGIKNISNESFGDDKTVEILEDFPSEMYIAIGGLVTSSAEFGNASLLFKKDQALNLNINEDALAYFTDQAGNYKSELIQCVLTF